MNIKPIALILTTLFFLCSNGTGGERSIPVFVVGDSSGYDFEAKAVKKAEDYVNSHKNLFLVNDMSQNCIVINFLAHKDSSNGVYLSYAVPIISLKRGDKGGMILYDGDAWSCFGSNSWTTDAETLRGVHTMLNGAFNSHSLTFLSYLFNFWRSATWEDFHAAARSANLLTESIIKEGTLKRSTRHSDFAIYGDGD